MRITRDGICIIPARGGSKRFPNKNLAKFQGLSLARHAVKCAADSDIFSKIILSSDSSDILNEAKNISDKVELHLRSESLSSDSATALEVVSNIVEGIQSCEHSFVTLILPTAPTRKPEHLKEAFENLQANEKADGIVSLTEFEFPPQLSVSIVNNYVNPVFTPSPLIEGNTRSQDQDIIYRPNGAFYMQKYSAFIVNKNFWKGNVLAYPMSRIDSADIDTPLDLKIANLTSTSLSK